MSPKTYPDPHHDTYSKTVFGFWLYLITDFVLFASLFATYAVLHENTFGGPTAKEIFNMPLALFQTILLLTCALASGVGGAAAHRKQKNTALVSFLITFVLGAASFGLLLGEFNEVYKAGADWATSAFLSAYFSVVGTFGAHILVGLLWIILFLIPVWREGINNVTIRRLTCLRMFWQFLSVVWVFIFTLVYLMGGV